MTEQLATIETCRLALARLSDDETELETIPLGHVHHEAEPREWFAELPEGVEEGETWLVVELWQESAARRWMLDERTVSPEIADALVEGRLSELMVEAVTRPV